MDFHIYHEGHEYKFKYDHITTVGDLQMMILQSLNIRKEKLLCIMHQNKILGEEPYLFTDDLQEKNLVNSRLFVIMDYFEVEGGTKETYNTWLESQIQHNDAVTNNLQLMYFNTLNSLPSGNLQFFTSSMNTQSTNNTTSSTTNNNTNTTSNDYFTLPTRRRRRRQQNTSSLFSSLLEHSSSNTSSNNNQSSQPQSVYTTQFFTGNGTESLQNLLNDIVNPSNNYQNDTTTTNLNSSNGSSGLLELVNEMLNNQTSGYDIGISFTTIPMSSSSYTNLPNGQDFFSYILNNLESVPITLSRRDINRLPVFKFSELPNEIRNETQCSICLEDFQDNDEIRCLLCQHYFHPNCIDRWLAEENVRCPICRHDNREENTSTSNNNQSSTS